MNEDIVIYALFALSAIVAIIGLVLIIVGALKGKALVCGVGIICTTLFGIWFSPWTPFIILVPLVIVAWAIFLLCKREDNKFEGNKICPQCGKTVKDGINYCTSCGSKIK